jgi:hypothetical protein
MYPHRLYQALLGLSILRAWDGSGAFTRTKDWTEDRDAAIKILASRHDENDNELTDGIAACITKNGESKATADFRPNADNAYSLGGSVLRWVNLWISTAVKFKQASFAGTLQAATLTGDRTWTLGDQTGVVVSTGVAVEPAPDITADSLFGYDASAAAPKLFPMSALLPTGVTAGYLGLVAPPGWVLMIGRTIGDASSSATERANADTAALFTLLWTSMANTEAPVSGGRGASAAADFAAHKTLTLLNPNGRAIIGKGQGNTAEGGGLGTNRVHGSSGGAETHTLTTAQMPAHTHSKSTTSTPGGASPAAGQGAGTDTTGSTGGGTSHPIMSPWLAINFIVKL